MRFVLKPSFWPSNLNICQYKIVGSEFRLAMLPFPVFPAPNLLRFWNASCCYSNICPQKPCCFWDLTLCLKTSFVLAALFYILEARQHVSAENPFIFYWSTLIWFFFKRLWERERGENGAWVGSRNGIKSLVVPLFWFLDGLSEQVKCWISAGKPRIKILSHHCGYAHMEIQCQFQWLVFLILYILYDGLMICSGVWTGKLIFVFL